MKDWLVGHRRVVGMVAGVVALGVAGLYLFIVPAETGSAPGWLQPVLRYAHPLCWLLLCGAAFGWAGQANPRLVAGLAWAGLACYGSFMVALLAVQGGLLTG